MYCVDFFLNADVVRNLGLTLTTSLISHFFFLSENEIDASLLPELSKEDLLQLGFKFGPALKLLSAVKKCHSLAGSCGVWTTVSAAHLHSSPINCW